MENVVDGGELTRYINEKKKPGVLKLIDVHSVKNVLDEIISSINMWNIVNL